MRTQIPQDHINRICVLSPDELGMIEESLDQLGGSAGGFLEDQKESGVMGFVDKQVAKQLGHPGE